MYLSAKKFLRSTLPTLMLAITVSFTGYSHASNSIRVNIGGDSYTDTSGNLWQSDKGCVNSNVDSVGSTAIKNTSDDYLYLNHRWGKDLSCKYTVGAGRYKVKLLFAETNTKNFHTGARVFDVKIEGKLAFDNVDIYSAVGGNAKLAKSKTIDVSDGTINIQFIAQSKNPVLKAVEIIPENSSTSTSEPTTSSEPSNTTSVSTGGNTVFYRDFENEKVGYQYTRDDLKTKMKASTRGLSLSDKAIRIVNDPATGGKRGKVMRIFHPAGRYGEGAQWIMDFEAANELYFAYEVYFKGDAEFVKGGKLPGLASVNYYPNPSSPPDGTDLWSARNMWWADGLITSYVYHADQPDKYGDTKKWNTTTSGKTYLKKGQWNTIEVRIKVNTPGKKDGLIQGWHNGKLVFQTKAIMFRMPGGSHLKIGSLTFMNRYGGGNSSWAPTKDQYIYFDNIVISKTPITH